MSHVLIPIDFSNDSINAFEHGIALANKLSYNIKLIHVKRKNADYNATFNLHDFDEVLISGIEDNFEKLLKNYTPGILGEVDYRIREGRIYNEICNQAKYGDAEMIIMGTHGVSGFEERWVGSNAFRIASNAPCPVFTIRYNYPQRTIKKIILPIDVSNETRQKVPFVAKLAQIFSAEVHVIDVRENNKATTRNKLDEFVDQVLKYLKRRKIKCIHESLKGKNITDITIEYAILCDADLIAIMNEKNERAKHIWLGPYAQQMVNHSPIPVISIQSKDI
ncbi:MAG: universal stress protein [Salinivirgaceae bacterium]|jgi:nucleotide-binding universal stress UspA family protein|nr:universal stress protein [Salinivirgaceae bacterium]